MKRVKSSQISELKLEFPNSNIVCLPNDVKEPLEVVCEVDKKASASIAVAIISRSEPHYHRETTEIYIVEKGTLILHIDDEIVGLFEGRSYVIPPFHIHWAECEGNKDPARVRVISIPPWKPDDHILIQTK